MQLESNFFKATDYLTDVIYSNYRVLVVLDRMGIKLGFGNKTIAEVIEQNNINTAAFMLIINLFCYKNYVPQIEEKYDCIPDILVYLKNSHRYFLEEKIPAIRENIKEFANLLHDSKSDMVETVYANYAQEVKEHIEYENEIVFPYIEKLYRAHQGNFDIELLLSDYDINIFSEHHDDIEEVLMDLKNILIRHFPQFENGKLRRTVLQQIFELEDDLFSHTRIEEEVLIPLVNRLENRLDLVVK